jgi:DNA polymerase-3 subunit gamma/tau
VLALYRKYRPSKFEDVIAQEHITRTLTNQISADRITHAYLFTGSRGTGKTTCARIFARAINCTSPVNGSPCGKCATCKALTSGNIDIIELDAASNNGVDQVRDIVDNVQYPPVSGRYKVYIIDEVHMLTPAAFNALLKTLEEPPAHSVFILATTEVHKLPATVLSRCMRFDFRLVPQETLKKYLKGVYEQENVTAEEEALNLIASAAEGSVRDMLSIADRCMNFSTTLTYNDVLSVLGASGKEGTKALFTAIAESNVGGALCAVDDMCSAGKSVSLIAKDLCSYARDLLVLKTTDKGNVLGSREELARMKEESNARSVQLLVEIINIFSSIDTELRYSVSPRIVLECATMRACKLAVVDLSAIEERLTRIENRLNNGDFAVPTAPMVTAVQKQNEGVRTSSKPMDARSVWGRITTYCRMNESSRVVGLLGGVKEVVIEKDKLIVWADADNFLALSAQDTVDAITRALEVNGDPFTLVVNKQAGGVDMDSEISKIKKMIGDAKLNIKNARN